MSSRITNQIVETAVRNLANMTGLTVEWENQSGYHNLIIAGSKVHSATNKADFYDAITAMTNLLFTLNRTGKISFNK